MSKSKYNVVSPDLIVEKYGADTLRMYEMFLGPLEQFKPWNTNGISGVNNFLRKFWRLFHDSEGNFVVTDTEATKEELKTLKLKPSPKHIFTAVVNIRNRKLPNPKELGNSGSFFKNPIISTSKFKSLQKKFPAII